MEEPLLSPEVLDSASLRGNEYGWPPENVEAAINDARHRGIVTIGGQAQFRLPDGTCELYWIDVDPADGKLGEPWMDKVNRSADEAIAKFRDRMAKTDWKLEIQNWPFLHAKAESGVSVMKYLYFVLYFSENPRGPATAV